MRRWAFVGLLPLFVIALVTGLGVLGPFLAPIDPFKVSLLESYLPPAFMEGGKATYWLGTDALGRDIFSRILYGARATLEVSASAILLGGAVGTFIGLIAGYAGGATSTVIMRIVDATLAFPVLFIGLLLSITVGASSVTVIVAISLILWARFARVARGEVLTLRQRDFIALARIGGCSWWRIFRRHLLPNIANTLLVVASLQMGLVIITESSLSFLGAGVPPPTPTWGAMVADGRNEITGAWWISFFPGSAILITVLAANLVGDWLRDVWDPKLRQI